jgi:spore maturation protein SpmB
MEPLRALRPTEIRRPTMQQRMDQPRLRFSERARRAAKRAIPSAAKTVRWLVPLTAGGAFVILLLRQSGALAAIADAFAPVCRFVGLPGEAALAYVSAYFVNIYACIAVMDAVGLSGPRAVTILSVMALCAHNIIAETAVQVRTGSSALRMVFIRTAASIGMAWILNRLMPGSGGTDTAAPAAAAVVPDLAAATAWGPALRAWFVSTLRLLVKLSVLIFGLTLLQALLAEFGLIAWLGRRLRSVMRLFGLRPDTAFLWIVANTLGLAYGAAIMIEECEQGRAPKEESDLFNHHIAVAHSNIEDLLLLVSVGGSFGWLLLSRWALAWVLVWERRLELSVRRKLRRETS